jgi:hypothetical protein
MALVLNVSDFRGRHLLAKTTYNVDTIQACIDQFEKKAIYDLLGVTLGEAFISDLSGGGVPQDPLFTLIFNPLAFDHCGKVYTSNGIKIYLLGIVYFKAITEARLTPSISAGAVVNGVEVASQPTSLSEVYQRYNDSVDISRVIQLYIEKNLSDYPDFNGQRLLYNY